MKSKTNVTALSQLFLSAKNKRQMHALLQDILTEAEISEISQRWEIIQGLLEGKPQRRIQEKAEVSISKVTRASHLLKESGTAVRRAYTAIKKKRPLVGKLSSHLH